jgi:hypothetical protein
MLPRKSHRGNVAQPQEATMVINSACDLCLSHGPCTICGGHLQYPYLEWHRSNQGEHIRICGKCCQKIKKGFTADLIQITASMELRELYTNSRPVFVRKSTNELVEEHQEEHEQAKKEAIQFPINRN